MVLHKRMCNKWRSSMPFETRFLSSWRLFSLIWCICSQWLAYSRGPFQRGFDLQKIKLGSISKGLQPWKPQRCWVFFKLDISRKGRIIAYRVIKVTSWRESLSPVLFTFLHSGWPAILQHNPWGPVNTFEGSTWWCGKITLYYEFIYVWGNTHEWSNRIV